MGRDCAYSLWELEGSYTGYRVTFYEENDSAAHIVKEAQTLKEVMAAATEHLNKKMKEAERVGGSRIIDCLRRHQLPISMNLQGYWLDRNATNEGYLLEKLQETGGLMIGSLMSVLRKQQKVRQLEAEIRKDKGKPVLEVEPKVPQVGDERVAAGPGDRAQILVFDGEGWVAKPIPEELPEDLPEVMGVDWASLISTGSVGKTCTQIKGIVHHLKEKAKTAKVGDRYVVAYAMPTHGGLVANHKSWTFLWDGEQWAEEQYLTPNQVYRIQARANALRAGQPDPASVEYAKANQAWQFIDHPKVDQEFLKEVQKEFERIDAAAQGEFRRGIGIHGDGNTPQGYTNIDFKPYGEEETRNRMEEFIRNQPPGPTPGTITPRRIITGNPRPNSQAKEMWEAFNQTAETIAQQQKGPEPIMPRTNPTPDASENEMRVHPPEAVVREISPAEQSILDKYKHEIDAGHKQHEIAQLEAIAKQAEMELAQNRKELKKIRLSQRKKATLVQNVSLSAVATLILYLVMSKVFGRPIPDLRLQAPTKLRKGRKRRRPTPDDFEQEVDSRVHALPAPKSPPFEEKVTAPRSRVRTRSK